MFLRLPQLPGRIALKDPGIWISRPLLVDEADDRFPRWHFPRPVCFLAWSARRHRSVLRVSCDRVRYLRDTGILGVERKQNKSVAFHDR